MIETSSRQRGYNIRTVTAKVELKKKLLVVSLKELVAKTKRLAVNLQSQINSDCDSDSE
jgi:hypothetical protein